MEDNKNHPEGCRCPLCVGGKCTMCGEKGCPACPYCSLHGGYYRWHWVKLLLGIIVLFVVFWCGFRLGTMVSSWGGGYGSYGMPGRYLMRSNGYNGGYPMPMMYGYYENYSGSSTSPTTK